MVYLSSPGFPRFGTGFILFLILILMFKLTLGFRRGGLGNISILGESGKGELGSIISSCVEVAVPILDVSVVLAGVMIGDG